MREREVVVSLVGGLGNQLFQYAAGKAIADQSGARLTFRESLAVGTPTFLAVEDHRAALRTVRRLAVYLPPSASLRHTAVWEARRRLLAVDRGAHLVFQRDAFSPRPHDALGDERLIGLMGYFQHPSWYEPALDSMIDMVDAAVDRELGASGSEVLASLGDYTVVALRRGDYLRNRWELPIEYYERAINGLPRRGGPLLVVSDDELVGEIGRGWFAAHGFTVVDAPDLECGGRSRDLALLRGASQVVMANSTFCWWGTVLGDRRAASAVASRTVIAPSGWIPSLPSSASLLRSVWTLV